MKAAPPDYWKPLEESIPHDVFKAEVQSWARRIQVVPKVIQLRPMRRKWGSCSKGGWLTFDTDLLRQHAKFRHRVIIE